nr:RDD family protein [Allomeiothermus silvanus]
MLPTACSGQTLGKRLMGIKVINAQGRAPGYGPAAMREVLGKILSALPLYLGYLVAVFHPEKRALHDLIGGTWVVVARSPAPVLSETPESPR